MRIKPSIWRRTPGEIGFAPPDDRLVTSRFRDRFGATQVFDTCARRRHRNGLMKHHKPTTIPGNEDVCSEICAAAGLADLGSTPGCLNAVHPCDRSNDIDRGRLHGHIELHKPRPVMLPIAGDRWPANVRDWGSREVRSRCCRRRASKPVPLRACRVPKAPGNKQDSRRLQIRCRKHETLPLRSHAHSS